MVNEIRMRRVNWIKPGCMKNGRTFNGRKTGAVMFVTFVALVLVGLATFERSRQSNRGRAIRAKI